jgi:hypothetical protein
MLDGMLDHIQADRFYQDNADKIKLNWLCYEYAIMTDMRSAAEHGDGISQP